MRKPSDSRGAVLIGLFLLMMPSHLGVFDAGRVETGQVSGNHGSRQCAGPCLTPPVADAGSPVVAKVGELVQFWGAGTSADDEIIEYRWDFDGDESPDFVSARSGFTTHRFDAPGKYRCLLTVKDASGLMGHGCRVVRVLGAFGSGDSADGDTDLACRSRLAGARPRPPDCVCHRYAVIVNGSDEPRFSSAAAEIYEMLTEHYGFLSTDIYLLDHWASGSGWQNPEGMVDADASTPNRARAFSEVALRADQDDEVYIWLIGHGRGYEGPYSRDGRYFGWMTGRASVDPGDEPDYPESDFKLRMLHTGGDAVGAGTHGLNVWKAYYEASFWPELYRNMYLSRLDGIHIEGRDSTVYDEDVLIERLIDYALGDFNRDGRIDHYRTDETFDWDGDGLPAFDPVTGDFDEDEWGDPDSLEDDWYEISTRLPVDAYPICLFDPGHRGRLCIDLGYDGGTPEIDGSDEDGDGLLDWIDANQDGDTDDVISIDEALCVQWDDFYDDEMAEFVNGIHACRIMIIVGPCYSGGWVDDLSGWGRVICTASTEEAVSWGEYLLNAMTGALRGIGDPRFDVDADANGYVSILEAFNYAAWSDPKDEIPQYDDNGDAISHGYPLPASGDGLLGGQAFLCDTCSTTVCPGNPCAGTVVLLQNRPNPFSDETEIYYWLPAPSRVSLRVYDVQGRMVAELARGLEVEGPHTISWNGTNREGRRLPSGVYAYKLETRGYGDLTKRLLILR